MRAVRPKTQPVVDANGWLVSGSDVQDRGIAEACQKLGDYSTRDHGREAAPASLGAREDVSHRGDAVASGGDLGAGCCNQTRSVADAVEDASLELLGLKGVPWIPGVQVQQRSQIVSRKPLDATGNRPETARVDGHAVHRRWRGVVETEPQRCEVLFAREQVRYTR